MTEPNTRQELLFGYGTLREDLVVDSRSSPPHHAEHIGTGAVPGRMVIVQTGWGKFAGLLRPETPAQMVVGEVYRLHPPDGWREDGDWLRWHYDVLDHREGYYVNSARSSFYLRGIAPVYMHDGRELRASTYFYNPDNEHSTIIEHIPSGDWNDYLRSEVVS